MAWAMAQMTPNDSAKNPRLGMLLWLAGMLGVFVVTFAVLPQLLSQLTVTPPAPLRVLLLASLAQSAILLALAVWSGVALAPKVGLRAPAFEAAASAGCAHSGRRRPSFHDPYLIEQP